MTRFYGVVGDPIAHSLSPLIHNGWMRDHNIGAQYRGLQVAEGGLAAALETMTHRGIRGLNVTMPHKLAALELSTERTPRAQKIGAANTLWRPGDGTWSADNTDAPGFVAALTPLIDREILGQRVLVLGAGGAARAVVYALCDQNAKVTLANRTLEKATRLAADFPDAEIGVYRLEDALIAAGEFDLLVNTTSVGHSGGHLGLPAAQGKLLYDISYGKAAQSTLVSAEARGWRTADGLSMLVYQAAFAFDRWFSIMPNIEKAMKRVQKVLEMS